MGMTGSERCLRIDARFKQLPRGVASRPGALDRDVGIAPQGKLLLPTFKAIAVMPVPAALRTDLKVRLWPKDTLLR